MPGSVRRSPLGTAAVAVAILAVLAAVSPTLAQVPGLTQRYSGAGTISGDIPTLPTLIPVTAYLALVPPGTQVPDGEVFHFQLTGSAAGQTVPFTASEIDDVVFNPGSSSGELIVDFDATLTASLGGITVDTSPIPFTATVDPGAQGHLHSVGGPFPVTIRGQTDPVAELEAIDTVLGAACLSDLNTLCLNNGRFQVTVDWRNLEGVPGQASIVQFGSNDSGLLYFFEPDNWEMLLKVIDGCAFTNHYWVFAAATTNVEYTIRVIDTDNGAMAEYFNPLENRAPAITDTAAFATCP